ncbi:MAG: Lrp/AsnC family transcriptional regulator [Hoeflea sp.]|uniref:Lrp/AsnC family transcriptional regulator n=1 Tax=Hoeflea sp. TaxID=1940281 RepID=UPI001E0EB329|nr:Lrp/AsnC family transcriptional regulator [Hoeflea sp.]MBU4531301.1 Lrp/AsnC family transcriptional regulator [Alphaproteobacteria bacterium]MBU4544158.1 Lrp/AsnC family transcriptional regulator [Alphaproteobacteria bacterium]MBU4550605.1 Lrp/AsnC family transcriptional regulator [Alphaproteobacteria bacterium]MBV1724578.1 Lrp/AsnC family transcriptional regulator [Hoeflea sp.]MBV1760598.1 Lrp/AsnC family transcriptional regulator [Hoeflea sp.]
MAPLKLDDRDIKILAILSREGRISKSDLAKRVNLSATPCWERLSRLEKAGIISGYHADIELRHVAPQVSVFVMAELDNHRAATFQAFEAAIASYDEILSCWALGGGFDYLMHVVTRDIDSYQRLIDDLLSRRAGLARYFTYIVTKPVKHSAGLPFDLLLETGPETK